MMVVHLDWLTPYQGTTWDEWPLGVNNESRRRVITMRNELRGRKARPVTDVTHSPQKKNKWQYACRLLRTNSLKEEAMWHIDLLLGNNHETSSYTTAVTE
jgi:hypothetical protein